MASPAVDFIATAEGEDGVIAARSEDAVVSLGSGDRVVAIGAGDHEIRVVEVVDGEVMGAVELNDEVAAAEAPIVVAVRDQVRDVVPDGVAQLGDAVARADEVGNVVLRRE